MTDIPVKRKPNSLCVLIAPDSFKDSISAADAALAIEKGLRCGIDSGFMLRCMRVPIADGGEGTLEALVAPESKVCLSVTGTDGRMLEACYGSTDNGSTAVIEMAAAAGLTLVPEAERNVLSSTTYGVGQLITDALDRGYRKLLLTVGGSGTNDGGCGMLAALGAVFGNRNGSVFIPTGGTLSEITSLDIDKLDPRLADCEITIATDVANPLTSSVGATFVYGKQKGADEKALTKMESGMCHYASILTQLTDKNISSVPGCGAGGGIAAPLLAFTQARIESGIQAVLDAVGFEQKLRKADIVITGEGKLDRQSLYGKAISGVTCASKKYNVPVFALVGCIGDNQEELLSMGLSGITAISEYAPSFSYSMTHAAELLEQAAFELWDRIQAK